MSTEELSDDWLERALAEPPGTDARRRCIERALELEKRPHKGRPRARDATNIFYMLALNRLTGEARAGTLARAMVRGELTTDYACTADSTQRRLALEWKKQMTTGWGKYELGRGPRPPKPMSLDQAVAELRANPKRWLFPF